MLFIRGFYIFDISHDLNFEEILSFSNLVDRVKNWSAIYTYIYFSAIEKNRLFSQTFEFFEAC